MTRTTRRLIFYCFVALFIIITPPTILYAIGYTYDFQTNKIVQTGGIYLKATPNTAQISVNGKNSGTTARLISRLAPGDYKIGITKDGYFSWQKTLSVSPKLVTEARNIYLFPQKIIPELIASNATSTLKDFLQTAQEKLNEALANRNASSTAGWLLNNGSIFYISQANFMLYREDMNGGNPTQISKNPLPGDHYRVFSNDGRSFAALSNKGFLYYFNPDKGLFDTIAAEIKNAVMSGDNKKILYWNDNEIWVYYLQNILVQPYKTAGDKELVTRFAQKISQAIFYPDNEHIAFAVNDQIKITELDSRDSHNTVDFIGAAGQQIYFDQKNNYFYYLTGNQIFRVTLQ